VPGIEGATINIGSGKKISMGELLTRITDIMKVSKAIVQQPDRIRPEKSEVGELICDNTKARHVLGWAPRYSLDDGLNETIEYLRKNISLYKTAGYVI
jgi:nucleoside-diphosphate-sugar epimerase